MTPFNETYLEQGYVIFKDLLPLSLMESLRSIVNNLVDDAAALIASDEVYEILDDPKSGKPRIERIKSPHKLSRETKANLLTPKLKTFADHKASIRGFSIGLGFTRV